MDNISHGLAGLALAAFRPRSHDETDRAVLWAGFLGGEAPDIDVPLRWLGIPIRHRTWTHTLVAAPLLALGIALVLKLIFRRARFSALFGWALGGVLFGHLLLDVICYGIPVVAPFTWSRVRWDLLTFFDPVFWVPLLAALIWGLLRPKTYHRAVRFAGAVVLAYVVMRAGSNLYVGHRVRQETGARTATVSAPFLRYHIWRWSAPGRGSGTALVFPPRLQ